MLRMSVHGRDLGTVEPLVLEEMFRLRHKIFKERLRWDVRSHGGMERDQFDDCDPTYLILQQEGAVIGSARLLRTTGPHMLRDVFADVLNGRPAPVGPSIWESTRFAVDTAVGRDYSLTHLGLITSSLLSGMWELAIATQLTAIISVYDGRMERILRRAGCTIESLGRARGGDGVEVIAGYFPVNHQVLRRLREVGGITEPMLPDFKTSGAKLAGPDTCERDSSGRTANKPRNRLSKSGLPISATALFEA